MNNFNKADIAALENKDDIYFLEKGGDCYLNEEYNDALTYYSIASSLGNVEATKNLGYIYMYGRTGVKNLPLAFSYFKLASSTNHPEALYKVGTFYDDGLVVDKSKETALYYYEKAVKVLNYNNINLEEYPSLALTLAKEKMEEGTYLLDPVGAYYLLKIANRGYTFMIFNGETYYSDSLNEVKELEQDKIFNEVKLDYEDGDERDYLFSKEFTTNLNLERLVDEDVKVISKTEIKEYFGPQLGSIIIEEGTIGKVVDFTKDNRLIVDFDTAKGTIHNAIINRGSVSIVIDEGPVIIN